MSVAPVEKRLKPTVTATITPMRRRASALRDHLIELVVKHNAGETKHAELAGVLREALGAFKSALSGPARGGSDASVVWPDRPPDDLVEQLRRVLVDAGYRPVVRENAEPACSTGVMVDWNHLSQVPPGWFNNEICGAHHYRQCASCGSIYRMSSTNSVEPAPSMRCQVCGVMMVEWGSSKIWQAELVTAGSAPT
jgi:hypothetical protein